MIKNKYQTSQLRSRIPLNVKVLSLCLLFATTCQGVSANEQTQSLQQWQPVSAESLIELPANLIEKRIQQDFRMSPMATELLQMDKKISNKSQQIAALQSLLEEAGETEMIDERVDLIQLKSSFLDLMQAGQKLRQSQLENKISVYQAVLFKLNSRSQAVADSQAFQLHLSQKEARQRMDKVMAQVDQTLLQDGFNKQSPYAQEFASNLAKIEQLKEAISAHESNLAAMVDGVEVSTQEYIRQLLMQSSSEQSLLDQEALMLSYMAKIVALDAQSLEFSISEMQEQQALSSSPMTTPANSVALFL